MREKKRVGRFSTPPSPPPSPPPPPQEFVKKKIEKTVNIVEVIFYLKSMYSTQNEEPRPFVDDIPTDEPSFEAMTNHIKR